jgi:RimJ/RimL family protein N-acetyltransferase
MKVALTGSHCGELPSPSQVEIQVLGEQIERSPAHRKILMISLTPTVLERDGIRLEPLGPSHLDEIARTVADGELWNLWFTGVPRPQGVARWLEAALEGQAQGHMLPWAVRELDTGEIVGSTRFHDIVAPIDRVEIGYTFYAQSRQRTRLNTTCKLMLLQHAFETVGCKVVGLRTDHFNFRSQRAIEALGAKKDGVLRHHQARRDGSPRDTVMYSILLHEWPDIRRHLEWRLQRHAAH